MDSTEKRERILGKTLTALQKKEHLPCELIYLLSTVSALQLEAHTEILVDLPDLDLSALGRRVEEGGSLFTQETFPLDPKKGMALLFRIIDRIIAESEKMPDPMVRAVLEIKKGIDSASLDLGKACHECICGEGPITSAWAERTPDAPSALRFLILASLEPLFHAVVKTLEARLHDQNLAGGIRQTGTCPICGSHPYIHELRGKEGFRFAVCSFCHNTYRVRRIACPRCDTADSEKVTFFTVEGESGFRVEACAACNTYIKTIDFRGLDREAFPALNDLESLALDFLAVEQGLTRTTLSVWGV